MLSQLFKLIFIVIGNKSCLLHQFLASLVFFSESLGVLGLLHLVFQIVPRILDP